MIFNRIQTQTMQKKMKLPVPDYILSIKPYVPGKPIEELEREYGISEAVKIASNENPLGPSPLAVRAVQEAIGNLHRYPDGSGHALIDKISKHLGVAPGQVVLGNGSDEIIGMLTRVFLQPGDEVILPRPSFLMYEILTRSAGARPVFVPLKSLGLDLDRISEMIGPNTRMIFVCNPNNPTGTIISGSRFERFMENIPSQVVVVVDEAYIEFVRDPDCAHSFDHLNSGKAIVSLRTFSKIYGLAGLRIGYGIMPEYISGLLNRVRQPFNANSLAQAGACAALDDTAFFQKTLRVIHEGLDYLFEALSKRGIRYFKTQANFFLIDVKKSADEVFESLLREGIIVRSMASYGFPEYIRINVGLPEENALFIQALEKILP